MIQNLPSVKNSALGDNVLVDLGARIEGQRHGLSSKTSQQVPKNMNLEEIVQKHKKNEQEPQKIMINWYDRRRY